MRGDRTWESFTPVGNVLETFAEDIGLGPPEVFPQFPAEQPQSSQRFAKYLYTPYVLPNFGENAGITWSEFYVLRTDHIRSRTVQ